MMDKYGFTPTQFIDFKGLMGDPSDNIPGIPGVGEKTATKLILEYGSVENLIANVDNVKPKGVKAKVEEHAQACHDEQAPGYHQHPGADGYRFCRIPS